MNGSKDIDKNHSIAPRIFLSYRLKMRASARRNLCIASSFPGKKKQMTEMSKKEYI